MLLLWGVVGGVLVGLLRGGSIANLEKMGISHLWLVSIALIIQLLVFPLFSEEPLITFGTELFHLASYFILFIFVILNWGVWQIPIMGLGMTLNLLVIGINGGYMPASVKSLERAGESGVAKSLLENGTYGNVIEMSDSTALDFLGDWLYLPKWFPFSTAFSLGDTIIAIGLVLFFGLGMVNETTGT
ncbi:MAG: DUF5317 domain-containing protein [Candidatus Bipolaricaulota bacterium]|nr:DUF5317 domain-containing protein [Candidatus Bipolaricaulota bacterium]MBS3791451.1 DUF5317 domain-containing protein [Candidatus Bipolaricaulota bacterium]